MEFQLDLSLIYHFSPTHVYEWTCPDLKNFLSLSWALFTIFNTKKRAPHYNSYVITITNTPLPHLPYICTESLNYILKKSKSFLLPYVASALGHSKQILSPVPVPVQRCICHGPCLRMLKFRITITILNISIWILLPLRKKLSASDSSPSGLKPLF